MKAPKGHKCKRCGKTQSDGVKFSGETRNNGYRYIRSYCNQCVYQRYKRGESKKKGTLICYTTMKEREENGWRCLAIDTLATAVTDMKRGQDISEFVESDWFDTLCEMAELHPEWIRRGVQALDTQAVP